MTLARLLVSLLLFHVVACLGEAAGSAADASWPGALGGPARSAAGPVGYKVEPGPWKVESVDTVLRDAARQKDLEITVRLPRLAPPDTGRFPLVVFSHGAGGSRTAFGALSATWASHGYVVVHPTHADSIELRRRQGEDLSRLRRNLDSLRRDVRPADRLRDVVFLLDAIGEIEKRIPGLRDAAGAGRVDRERIGVAGHSAGAMTAQIAVGVKARGAGLGTGLAARDHGDPRIDCAVVVSGQGTSSLVFTADSWSGLDKPMLVITGSKDVAAIGRETPASRREPFDRARPGGKYLIFIEGATHSSYQGRDRALALDPSQPTDAELAMITSVTTAGTMAFLDACLKDDSAARAYLASDALRAFSDGKATLERK